MASFAGSRESGSNTAAIKNAEAQSADAKRKFNQVNQMKDEEIAHLKQELVGESTRCISRSD